MIEIDAASNNSVDDARLLIERAPLVAQSGKHKLYIIDECHMLTKEAFNALLKTIEEPPPNVVFILATTEEHKVPPTIVSRCQRLMFRLVNQPELVAHLKKIAELEKIEIEDDAIELIARRSGGGLRDALGLLDQASLLAVPGKPVSVKELLTLLGAVHEDVLLQISNAIFEHDGKAALEAAHALMMEGREPSLLALELAKHFLNLAKASYLAAGKTSNADTQSLILGSASYVNGLVEQAPKFDRAELAQIVEQLDKLEQTCKRSSQPALNLEIGLVALCHRQDILLLKDLSARVEQLEAELHDDVRPPSQMQSRSAPRKPHVATASPTQEPTTSPTIPQETASTQPEVMEEAKRTEANVPAPTAIDPAPVPENLQPEPTSQPVVDEHDRYAAAAKGEDSERNVAAPASSAGSSNDLVELEELWSNVMDELQRRSIPAFALVSQYAFPLSIEKGDLLVGVMVERYQKTIEDRSELITAACKEVLGRPVSLRVKFVDRNATAAAQRPRPKAKKTASASDDTGEESDGGGVATLTAPAVQQSPPPPRDSEEAIAPAPTAETAPPAKSEPSTDSGSLTEAYKLFEGPGSRRILPS